MRIIISNDVSMWLLPMISLMLIQVIMMFLTGISWLWQVVPRCNALLLCSRFWCFLDDVIGWLFWIVSSCENLLLAMHRHTYVLCTHTHISTYIHSLNSFQFWQVLFTFPCYMCQVVQHSMHAEGRHASPSKKWTRFTILLLLEI